MTASGSRGTILLLVIAASACTSREAEVAEYNAARVEHQRVFDSAWKKDYADALREDAAWVLEYGPRLRRLVGPLEMAGLSDSVTMNIGSASGPYDNTTAADGFVYRTTDSVLVFVTDTAILRSYMVGNAADGGRGSPAAIVSQPSFYSDAFGVGAAAYRCAVIPLTSTTRNVLGAMAIEYSQDQDSDCTPNAVAVSVGAGHRVVAAQRWIPIEIGRDPRRLAALAQALTDRLPAR